MKVLVIDDDANVRLIVRTVLEDEGFSVSAFDNAVDGIRDALKDAPDVILLDIMMADTDGFEACQALKAKELTKDIPVIMLSAKADPASVKRAKEAGAAGYIFKPFDPFKLRTRISALAQQELVPG
ncbi:MAG: two-component system response regulator [Terriglobia bacterium]